MGIGAVSCALAEALPPTTDIAHICMLVVVCIMVPPAGAGHGKSATSSHSQSKGGVGYSVACCFDFHQPQRAATAMAATVVASAATPSLRNACQAVACHTLPASATRGAPWSSVVDAIRGIHAGECRTIAYILFL